MQALELLRRAKCAKRSGVIADYVVYGAEHEGYLFIDHINLIPKPDGGV